jgi:CO dehydrogenase nickel-insertion accessory protein CooC1
VAVVVAAVDVVVVVIEKWKLSIESASQSSKILQEHFDLHSQS